MMAIGRLVFVALAALPAGASRVQDGKSGLDFPGLARSFLDENGMKDWDSPDGHTFDEVLDGQAFVHIVIGDLDARFPRRALAESDNAENFRSTVQALIGLQSNWSGWRRPEQAGEHAEDWKALGKWVKSWSPGKLAHADGGKSLLESLGANESVRAAVTRLEEFMRLEPSTVQTLGEHGRIVFAPDRRAFLELSALAGWLDPKLQAAQWNESVLEATIGWIGWTELVAMQYTLLPVDRARPFVGVSMVERDDSGLVQYMAERGAALLLRREFWRQTAHFFEQSLAANLVIAAAGKNNLRAGTWKLEYRNSGASTPPYERFVPGGNPNGGTLPPIPAGPGVTTGNATEVSLFRKTEGADHFLEPLRESQKAGAKLAAKEKKSRIWEDKAAHFLLHSLALKQDHAVSAPFLGDLAEKKPLPPLGFLDDYEEFFRAYRSGFLYWLETEALPEGASQAKFAELIDKHATRDPASLIDDVFEQVYGLPLSGDNGSTDSLEWRFLAWLAKKR